MKKAIAWLMALCMIACACPFTALTAAAENTVDIWVYADGFENWAGSPNKVNEPAVTQILFCPIYNGVWNTEMFYVGMPVTITMTATNYSFTFEANVSTVYNGGSWGICRIEPCLLSASNRFVPVKDVYYTATFSFSVYGERFTVTPDDRYVLHEEPIVPDWVLANDPHRTVSLFDLDGSDGVDVGDVSALLDAIAGTVELGEGLDTDLDGDGHGTVNDVSRLLDLLSENYLYTRNEADDGWIVTGTTQISGDVVLPDSYRGEPVTQIGKETFTFCRTLETLTIPESVTWIPTGAFDGCEELSEVVYGGRASVFRSGGVKLPAGCALTCLIEEDLIDALNYSEAAEISDLDGYDGILRVKTTGELLFSPNFNELRALISSSGRSYDEFTAYLRFSDETFVYPTVTVDPKKSKGAWVDFFLQGEDIDCGFCPTAEVIYQIELVLVLRSAPEEPLYYGTYTATAGADFADSPYYNPTPAGESGTERTYLLRYRASAGGRIVGVSDQYLTAADASSAVTAEALDGYVFTVWSDGVTNASRTGDTVSRNTTLTAYFAQITDGDLASVYIYTETGSPILGKEYENATLVIRGASDEKQNVTLPMTIKGRGNSSWNSSASQSNYDSKNSYSIKLEEKAQLLGIGDSKNKKWVLNANKFDLSGLRNYLVWELARRMGTINYVTDNTWVQLYVNGEYRGMYMLTEKIDVGKDRVNVNDSATGDPDKGYLMELDFRGQDDEDPWFDISGYGPNPSRSRYDAVEFVIKSDIEGQQDIDFIQDYVQRCHNAIMSGDQAAIKQLVDLPSLIDMYIIEELSKDCDAGRASFFICKDRGGKLYFTAPWDFDFGFGTYGPAQSTSGLVSKNSDCCTWFANLIKRSWFKQAVLSRMTELGSALLDTLDAVRLTGEFLENDANRNAEFWNLYGRNYHGYVSSQVSGALHTYDEHLQFILDWTVERWAGLRTALENY